MGQIVLITGATAGIGQASALKFASEGYNLILTGRREEKLAQLEKDIEKKYSVKVITLCFDVRKNEEVVSNIDGLTEEWKSIDILINNAGLAAGLAPVQNGSIDDWEKMIDTNVKGLLYMSKKVLNLMIPRKTGHIINVGSIASKEVYANGNVYCASKHAVEAITQGTRLDSLEHGIKVSLVSPGLVETEFSLVRFKGDEKKASNVYRGMEPLTGKDVAETIFFIASQPKHVNIGDVLMLPAQQGNSTTVYRNN